MRPIDSYFIQKVEPLKSCLQYLRRHILVSDHRITEAWKYGMPFYCINDKIVCYLWVHKKLQLPYIGIVEGNKINHPDLIQEKRARMKILLLEPDRDLPIGKINAILVEVFALY